MGRQEKEEYGEEWKGRRDKCKDKWKGKEAERVVESSKSWRERGDETE